MPTDKTGDEELELLAPWNENVKAEIQRRADNTNQLNVNCQVLRLLKSSRLIFTMAEF